MEKVRLKDRIIDVEFIDRGRFASVLRGKLNDKYVALKKIWVKSSVYDSNDKILYGKSNCNNGVKNYLYKCANMEIKILKMLKHKNIVSFIGNYMDNEYIVILLEYMLIDMYGILSNLGIFLYYIIYEIYYSNIVVIR